MRIKNFRQNFSLKLSRVQETLVRSLSTLPFILTTLVLAFTAADFLLKWGVLRALFAWSAVVVSRVSNEISAAPILFSLFFLLFFLVLIVMWFIWKRLQIVAGEFRDDFSRGLYNWEFGGEGWKIEREGDSPVLSVSESQDGGITKKGFSWSDYEFSFETKVVKDASGWLIRAANRNNYVMIQLSLKDGGKPMLRPHYRYFDQEAPWISLGEVGIETEIKRLEWIKVKIVVRGSTVDVFLDGKHELHLFLPDPVRLEKVRKVHDLYGDEVKQAEGFVALNYPTGRVGFRCEAQEHAHFKDVRVKPL